MTFIRRTSFLWIALSVWSIAIEAHADRVVLFPPAGAATDDRRQAVDALMSETLRGLGHDVIAGSAIQRGTATAQPRTEAEMVEVATANRAQWVLTSEVQPLAGQYRLHLVAGYTAVRRVESIDVNVVEADETERMRDVLRSLIRASGLGDDALRLSEDEPATPATNTSDPADEAAARAREEARVAREALAAREAAHAREEAAARATEFENRPRYGADAEKPWIGQLGLGMISLASHDEARAGGFLWDVQLRFGHGFVSAPGLELRGGLDIVGGASSGFALNFGGVYLASFFAQPVYIGGATELGLFVNTTGARNAGLLFRASAAVSWRVGPNFFLEGLLPEISYLSVGGGVVGVGLSVRGGVRF